jgi:inositol monophosphatase 3
MNLGGVIRLNKTGTCIIFGAILVLCLYTFTSNLTNNNAESAIKINLKQLLRVAIRAAQNGGSQVVAAKDNLKIKVKGLTKEGMEESVTTADYLSHCAIMGTLKHAYPSLNVISEESKVECDKNQVVDFSEFTDGILGDVEDELVDIRDITVWMDPLDATHEYTEKLYNYVTTMVCVAVRGQPIIGVIHKPFAAEPQTSWAWVDKIKSSNLKYTESNHDNLKVIISMSHSGEIKKVLDKNMKNYELISAAGAGYKSLEVASGNVDAYLHITAIKKWDICAGNAIINAMGGKMTTKFNNLIDYKDETNVKNENGIVATITKHSLFIGKL